MRKGRPFCFKKASIGFLFKKPMLDFSEIGRTRTVLKLQWSGKVTGRYDFSIPGDSGKANIDIKDEDYLGIGRLSLTLLFLLDPSATIRTEASKQFCSSLSGICQTMSFESSCFSKQDELCGAPHSYIFPPQCFSISNDSHLNHL